MDLWLFNSRGQTGRPLNLDVLSKVTWHFVLLATKAIKDK